MKSMREHCHRLRNSKFIRNVGVLATGAVAAQLVSVLVTPLITRIYGPEEFGQLGIFMNIISVLVPIVALSYPIAIVLPEERREAQDLAKLAFLTSSAASIFLFLILCLIPPSLLVSLGLPILPLWVWAVPFALFCGGILQVCQQWMIREKKFGLLAKASFYQSILTNGGKISLGIINPIGIMLIIMAALSSLIHALLLFPGLRVFASKAKGSCESKGVGFVAKKYIDFPIYRAPQTFINALSQGLPVFFIASFFGVKEAGFYTLATSIMGVPTALIGKSINDVFYSRIVETSRNTKKVGKVLIKSSLLLAGLGFFPYALVFLLGGWLFSLIFGTEWAAAGEYSSWLALWYYSMLFTTTCASSLPVLGALKFGFKFTIFKIAVRLLAVYVGCVAMKNPMDTVWLLGISGLLVNIIFLLLVLKIAYRKDESLA